MKQLLVIIALLAITLTAEAQTEQSKPYNEMTLEELKAVNVKKLAKTEKKAHKKALRTAQKAHKKALRAARKAEKAHKKAVAKRKKAAQKKLKKVHKVYHATKIAKDEFSTYVEVVGPLNFTRKANIHDIFSSNPVPQYSLISLINPDTDEHQLQAYVHTGVHDPNFTSDRLIVLGISAEEYARRKGFWRNFHTAALSGGAKRRVLPVRQSADSCKELYCNFEEDVSIQLKTEDLLTALHTKNGLAFRLSGERGDPEVVRIPYSYLVGYALRLSELNSNQGKLSELAQAGRNHILNSAD